MLYQPDKDNCAAGCGSARGYFNKNGALYDSPESGDQIFFWSSDMTKVSHTGIVVRSDGDRVYTIEGNTSDGTAIVDNGGAVCAKSYPVGYKRIAGYGRPNWSAAEEAEDGSADQNTEDEWIATDYRAKVVAESGGTVNLRKSPSVNGDLLKKVPLGEFVDVSAHRNDGLWAKVTYIQNDGTALDGFMMTKFLEDVDDQAYVTIDRAEFAAIMACLSEAMEKLRQIGEAVV